MKNRNKTILYVIILITVSVMFFSYEKKEEAKEEALMYAIMVEKADGKYREYKSDEWPKTGYNYNGDKTRCVDRERNEIGNVVRYDSRTSTAIMDSNKSAHCTLYFDKDEEAPTGNMYIGTSETQEYTNNKKEEIHIRVESEDAIDYCLTNEADSRSCTGKWKEIPTLTNKEFVETNYTLGNETGEVTVYLYLKDGANNISNVEEDKITLDLNKPVMEVVVTNAEKYTKTKSVIIKIKDEVSGLETGTYRIKYKFGTSAVTCNNMSDYTDITVSTRGTKEVTKSITVEEGTGAGKIYICNNIVIKDASGNELGANTRVSADMNLDNTKPTCTTSKTNTGTKDGVTVTVTCDDSIGEVDKCNSTNVAVTGVKSDKTYTVTDKAGNSNTCKVTVTNAKKYRRKTTNCKYDDCVTGNPNKCVKGCVEKCMSRSYSGACSNRNVSFSGGCGCIDYGDCELMAIASGRSHCGATQYNYAIGGTEVCKRESNCAYTINTCEGGYVKDGSESSWSEYTYDSCTTTSSCSSTSAIVTSCESATIYS